TVVLGTERLGRVLDEHEPVPVRDRAHLVELARTAEHVDGDDSPRPVGDRRLDRCRVHVQRLRVDVREYRRCAFEDEAVRRGDEGQRRRDHLVARADPGNVTEHVQSRRPARDRSRVRRTHPFGKQLLEPLDPRPERQPPGPEPLEHELLLALVDPRSRKGNLANCFRQASAGAGDTEAYSSQCAQRWLRPRTVSRYAVWISRVTGPGGPTTWSS